MCPKLALRSPRCGGESAPRKRLLRVCLQLDPQVDIAALTRHRSSSRKLMRVLRLCSAFEWASRIAGVLRCLNVPAECPRGGFLIVDNRIQNGEKTQSYGGCLA